MEATTPLWQTILTTIGSGTVATLLISFVVSWLMKKRDQEFEMSKHKLSVISNSLPIYAQLGSYYHEFSEMLRQSNPDIDRAFFCASRIFYFERLIFEKFGTIQLDSLLAEEIITLFEFDLGIDKISKNEMIELGEGYTNYKNFFKKNIDSPLLEIFNCQFITEKSIAPSTKKPNLEQKCRWYSELIFLELNEVYYIWYKEHPLRDLSRISPDLREFLMSEYPEYFKRIIKWETGGYL